MGITIGGKILVVDDEPAIGVLLTRQLSRLGFTTIVAATGEEEEIARRLQNATRETDTVARLGGDEFAVLATPLAHTDDIECISDRILSELRRPVEIEGTLLHPTASIGAALFPDSGQDSDALLTAADAALHVVKEGGRNGCHVHGHELERRVAHRLQLEEQVRRAVAEKDFCLHYQPLVSLDTSFRGAEALLCWSSPSDVPVEASEFMCVLDDTGLIVELGPWIIEQACQQLRRWRNDGCRVDRMAINISGRQVLAPDFSSGLRNLTREAGLQCCDIELEFTETTLQRDPESLRAVFSELSIDGYRLALDEFGAAYCSLSHLRNFAFDTLKLDESFVQSVTTDRYARNLAGGIIRLVHHLGLDIVAVGVETAEQLEALSAEGCSLVQGSLFGAPMAAEQFRDSAELSAAGRSGGAKATSPVSGRVLSAPGSESRMDRKARS